MHLNALSVFLYAKASDFISLCVAAGVSGLSYGLGGMYPVAILIHRWFPIHEGLAMGICASSSGLAITICAPILTALTENFSMTFAMYCELVYLLISLVVCFVLIRNYPKEELHFTSRPASKKQPISLNWMFVAIVIIGMLGGAFSYLTIHYNLEGFDPYQVSMIVSVLGLMLTVAKFLLGEFLDIWGAYRVNWLFLPMAILGCLIFSLGSSVGFVPALIAASLYGIGDSVATVGISTYARDLSSPETYAATQQQYQTATLLGGVIASLIPGLIATATGNYRGFYWVITALMVISTAIIQGTYRIRAKRNKII